MYKFVTSYLWSRGLHITLKTNKTNKQKTKTIFFFKISQILEKICKNLDDIEWHHHHTTGLLFFSFCRVTDAEDLIVLHHMMHPQCKSAKETKEKESSGLDLIKVSHFEIKLSTTVMHFRLAQRYCMSQKKWASTNGLPSYKFCFEIGSYNQMI